MTDEEKTREQLVAEEALHKAHAEVEQRVWERTVALEEQKRFLDKVLSTSLNGIYIYDLEKQNNVYINEQYKELTGWTLEDFNAADGETLFALFHPDDQPQIAAHMAKVAQASDDDTLEIEYRFKMSDGRWVWLLSRDRVFARKDEGEVKQFIGTCLDITERKQMEERLEERVEERTTQLQQEIAERKQVEQTLRGNEAEQEQEIKQQEALLHINQAVQKMTQAPDLGQVIQVFYDQLQRLSMDVQGLAVHQLIDEDTRMFSSHFVNPSKEINFVERIAEVLSVGISRVEDLTRVAASQQALKESEENIKLLLDSTVEGIYGVDTKGICTFANSACSKILGYDITYLVGKNMHGLIHHTRKDGTPHPEDECRIYQAFRDGEATNVDDEVFWRADRTSFPAEYRSNPIKSGDEIIGTVVTFLDLTEQKHVEDVLREKEHQWHLFTLATSNLLWNWNFEDDSVERNVVFETDFGYSHEEVVPTISWWIERLHEEDRENVLSVFQDALDGGKTTCGYEYRFRRSDGSYAYIRDRVFILRDTNGVGRRALGAMTDITERKQAEQDLIRTQRLRVAGELSAGVSHNLNNILNGVVGPAQLLKRMTKDEKMILEVDEILASSSRARDLVHRLHLSTRGVEEGNLQSVQVNEIVEEAIRMAVPRWKDEPEVTGIAIKIETGLEDVPSIKGEESSFYDIIVNLLFNAVDAMPEGGSITIGTQRVGKDVMLTFSDTGVGMAEETRRRVFEPFFTTKMDVGSGLGLSTAYGAVSRWGGSIDVESTPEKGTTFTLRLPVWTEEEEVQEEEVVKVRQKRPGKLVVVEDNQSICDFLFRLLSESHEVETILDGQEALEKFEPGCCDVAMIDLGMPGKPGDQVAREMQQADPSLVTVLITGWELRDDDPRVALFDFCIQKPFNDLDKVEDIVAQAIELHDARAEGKS